jgi:hypothetical protein
MTASQDHHIEITPEALKTIAAMRDRVRAVAGYYGQGSEEHAKIADSLSDVLARMFHLGGRIMRDGREDELCLIGHSFLVYGVVFFPLRNGDERDPLRGTWSIHS